MEPTPPASFAKLLRRYRLESGLTQEALAERARLSREAVSALERGERQYPRPDTVDLLAEALELADADRAALLTAATRPLRPCRPWRRQPRPSLRR
jgi:transcriptional regulator with XRE-family HTH domain